MLFVLLQLLPNQAIRSCFGVLQINLVLTQMGTGNDLLLHLGAPEEAVPVPEEQESGRCLKVHTAQQCAAAPHGQSFYTPGPGRGGRI